MREPMTKSSPPRAAASRRGKVGGIVLAVRVEERDVRRPGPRAEDRLEPGPKRRALAPVLGEAQDLRAGGARLRARRVRGAVVDDHDSLDERPSAAHDGADRRLGLVGGHEGDGTKIRPAWTPAHPNAP